MNEKNLKVLEQYDIEVKNARRGRECYIIETGQGYVLLREYYGAEERAVSLEQICSRLRDDGIRTDVPVASKEGSYVVTDRDGSRYMVRKWAMAQEIDVRNPGDIHMSVKNLARIHDSLTEVKGFRQGQKQQDIFVKRMRELRKIRRYIKEKKQKNLFELTFSQQYQGFMDQCQAAMDIACGESVQRGEAQALLKGCLYHGEYNQHNILKDGRGLMTVHLDQCAGGAQTEDLYVFMRKILEKHNWDMELGGKMMKTYIKDHPVTDDELQGLYAKFLFPEKFWKIANHYYNSKKTWMPDRSQIKMEKLLQQSHGRNRFLEYFKGEYLL